MSETSKTFSPNTALLLVSTSSMTSSPDVLGALHLSTSRTARTPERLKTKLTAWNWMAGESEWTIQSPSAHTPPHLASTWVGLPTVVEGDLTAPGRRTIVTTTAVMTVVTIEDTIATMSGSPTNRTGADRHHPTTVVEEVTDLAHGHVPTPHDATEEVQ